MVEEIIPVKFDKDANVEEKIEAMNEVVEGIGGKNPRDKNAKPTDKKAFLLTRDDACGLAFMQTRLGQKFMDGKDKMMVTRHSVLMDLMAWALNRPVWNFEIPEQELELMFKDMIRNWEKRYGKDAPKDGSSD